MKRKKGDIVYLVGSRSEFETVVASAGRLYYYVGKMRFHQRTDEQVYGIGVPAFRVFDSKEAYENRSPTEKWKLLSKIETTDFAKLSTEQLIAICELL